MSRFCIADCSVTSGEISAAAAATAIVLLVLVVCCEFG